MSPATLLLAALLPRDGPRTGRATRRTSSSSWPTTWASRTRAATAGRSPPPHLDRLAAGGIRYTRFYNTGRCCPTRAALLTGQYPHAVGVGHMTGDLGPEHPTFRGRLNDSCATNGRTARPGRVLHRPHRQVARRLADGGPAAARPRVRPLLRRGRGRRILLRRETGPHDPAGRTDPLFPRPTPAGRLVHHRRLDRSRHRIPRRGPRGRRTVLPVPGPQRPALPVAGPSGRHRRLPRASTWKGGTCSASVASPASGNWGSFGDEVELSPRPEAVVPWSETTPEQRERFDHIMACYAAVMVRMDQSIGRLLAALEGRGELENTLILFLSDNGASAEGGDYGRLRGAGAGLGRIRTCTRAGRGPRCPTRRCGGTRCPCTRGASPPR